MNCDSGTHLERESICPVRNRYGKYAYGVLVSENGSWAVDRHEQEEGYCR